MARRAPQDYLSKESDITVSAKRIVTSTSSRERGKTDWARVDAMTDEEIEASANSDPDATPTDLEFWKGAKLVLPESKQPVTLRIDRDVLAWFKAHRPRYQSRMNAVLKAYAEAHRKSG